MKEIIFTRQAPEPIGPYSQAILAGGNLYSSGQIALDPASGTLRNSSIEEETHQVCKNIMAVLQAASLDLSNVVSTTIYLLRMSDFAAVNVIYASYFNDTFPARTTVEVSRLPKDASIEISFIASLK